MIRGDLEGESEQDEAFMALKWGGGETRWKRREEGGLPPCCLSLNTVEVSPSVFFCTDAHTHTHIRVLLQLNQLSMEPRLRERHKWVREDSSLHEHYPWKKEKRREGWLAEGIGDEGVMMAKTSGKYWSTCRSCYSRQLQNNFQPLQNHQCSVTNIPVRDMQGSLSSCIISEIPNFKNCINKRQIILTQNKYSSI